MGARGLQLGIFFLAKVKVQASSKPFHSVHSYPCTKKPSWTGAAVCGFKQEAILKQTKKKPQQKIAFLNGYNQLRPLPWLRPSRQDHKYNTVPNAVPTQLQRHWRADTENTNPHNPVGIPRKKALRLLASQPHTSASAADKWLPHTARLQRQL